MMLKPERYITNNLLGLGSFQELKTTLIQYFRPFNQRWPESLFQTPTPLLFQNFWIRVRVLLFSNLRIRLLFRLLLQFSIQPNLPMFFT